MAKDESKYESHKNDNEEKEVACIGVVSLAEAAASSCRKYQEELDRGEKTSQIHDDHCLRKRRSD